MNPNIIKEFENYYMNSKVHLPSRFTAREFGFMFFDKDYVSRHIKFSREADVRDFLIKKVPSHAYYSTAYYKVPDANSMDEKLWLGADLVFDLDADHVPSAKDKTYEQMLDNIKEELKKLINDFLISDFGLNENAINIFFSGGRGYHIHIRKDDFVSLKSKERREIVSYIRGSGLTRADLFSEHVKNKKGEKSISFLSSSEYGWSGKFAKRSREYLKSLLSDYESGNMEKIKDQLSETPDISDQAFKELFEENGKKVKMIMNTGSFDVLSYKTAKFLSDLLETKVFAGMKGEIDEPVTTDIHRLIRLPGSLHGKTGFVVTAVKYKDLDSFEPLVDAIAPIFMNRYMKIRMLQPLQIKIKDEKFDLKGSEILDVPVYLAVFCALRNIAEIV
ncbi:MAG: DNA primase catalytic subunit PriS [Thermoplasmata archaeon]